MKSWMARAYLTAAQLPFATRLAAAGLVPLVIIVGTLAIAIAHKAGVAPEERAPAELKQNSMLVAELLVAYDRNLRFAASRMASAFTGSLPGKFTIDAANTVKLGETEVPTLRNGGEVLNLEFGPVDRFTKTTISVATVFVRVGEDFVGATTSLRKEDGTRAIGARLGKQHPAYESAISGQTWTGRERLFGKDYMTEIRPIASEDGTLIGLLCVGVEFTESLKALNKSINQILKGDSPQSAKLSPILTYLMASRSTTNRHLRSTEPKEIASRGAVALLLAALIYLGLRRKTGPLNLRVAVASKLSLAPAAPYARSIAAVAQSNCNPTRRMA